MNTENHKAKNVVNPPYNIRLPTSWLFPSSGSVVRTNRWSEMQFWSLCVPGLSSADKPPYCPQTTQPHLLLRNHYAMLFILVGTSWETFSYSCISKHLLVAFACLTPSLVSSSKQNNTQFCMILYNILNFYWTELKSRSPKVKKKFEKPRMGSPILLSISYFSRLNGYQNVLTVGGSRWQRWIHAYLNSVWYLATRNLL